VRANRLPAASGLRWIAGGFLIFRAAPLRQLALDIVALLAANVAFSLPVAGFPATWLLLPALVVGLHTLARSAALGSPPRFADIFAGFRDGFRAQLRMGAVFLAAMALALAASALADGGRLAQAMLGLDPLTLDGLYDDDLRDAFMVWGACEVGVLSLLWYGPLLAAWQGVPAVRAAFYSVAAVAINWRPVVVFGLAWAALFMLAGVAVLAVAALLYGGGLERAYMAMLALVCVLTPSWFGSSYLSYCEIFGVAPDPS